MRPTEITAAGTLPLYDIDSISVITMCSHLSDDVVVSDADEITLTEFMKSLPDVTAQTRRQSATGAAKPDTADELVRQYPWLEQHFARERVAHLQPAVDGVMVIADESADDDYDEVDDDGMEVLFRKLEEARAAAHADPVHVHFDDFKVSFISGAHDLRARKHDSSSHFANARGQAAKDWSKAMRLPMSARFEIGLYGDDAAACFARAWAHQMQFFFSLHVTSGDVLHICTAAEQASYGEPTEFTVKARELSGTVKYRRRTDAIRAMFT